MEIKSKDGTVSVDVSIELIDPEKAAIYLLHNKSNVALNTRKVKGYAKDIANDAWKVNGETIVFARNGNLMDGQTRLNAIIQGGKAVNVIVVRGVDDDAFLTLDTESKPAAVILKHLGVDKPQEVAAAARLILNYDSGVLMRTKRARTEITSYAAGDDRLVKAAQLACNIRKHIPKGAVAAVIYLGTRGGEYEDKMFDFVHGVATGTEMKASDPRFVLREWFINKHLAPDQKGAKTRLQGEDTDVFNAIVSAWNAYVSGREMKHMPIQKNVTRDILGYKPLDEVSSGAVVPLKAA